VRGGVAGGWEVGSGRGLNGGGEVKVGRADMEEGERITRPLRPSGLGARQRFRGLGP